MVYNDSQTEQEELEYAQAIENSLKPEDVLCQFCKLKFDTEDERLLHLVNQCPSIEDENKGRVVDCPHPAPETGTLISMNAKHLENILPPTSPQIISTVRTDYTLNRDLALKKKKIGCSKPPYSKTEHKDSTVLQLNTASFDLFTSAVIEHLENKSAYSSTP